jgi:uncharacterized protein
VSAGPTTSNDPRDEATTADDPGRVVVRDATVGDLPTMLAINNANVPAVNELDLAEITRLAGIAQASGGGAALVVEVDRQLAGFCLVYPPGIDYASLNYRWFSERYEQFVYLDRIAVDATIRRAGAGRAMYAALFDRFAGTYPRLTCEVNIKPLNQGSIDFHRTIGFVEVGQQDTEPSEDGSGRKRVSLLSKDLLDHPGGTE